MTCKAVPEKALVVANERIDLLESQARSGFMVRVHGKGCSGEVQLTDVKTPVPVEGGSLESGRQATVTQKGSLLNCLRGHVRRKCNEAIGLEPNESLCWVKPCARGRPGEQRARDVQHQRQDHNTDFESLYTGDDELELQVRRAGEPDNGARCGAGSATLWPPDEVNGCLVGYAATDPGYKVKTDTTR